MNPIPKINIRGVEVTLDFRDTSLSAGSIGTATWPFSDGPYCGPCPDEHFEQSGSTFRLGEFEPISSTDEEHFMIAAPIFRVAKPRVVVLKLDRERHRAWVQASHTVPGRTLTAWCLAVLDAAANYSEPEN